MDVLAAKHLDVEPSAVPDANSEDEPEKGSAPQRAIIEQEHSWYLCQKAVHYAIARIESACITQKIGGSLTELPKHERDLAILLRNR